MSEKAESKLNLVMAALGVVLKNQSMILATLSAMSEHDGVTEQLMAHANRAMDNAEKMMKAANVDNKDQVLQ
jgi:hypothetical protein